MAVRQVSAIGIFSPEGKMASVKLRPIHFFLILLERTVLNLSYRMVYPFLPEISRGVGAPFEQVAMLATFRSAFGLVSPFVGGIFDRIGYRKGLLIGTVIVCCATSMLVVIPGIYGIILVFAAIGIAKAVYDPSVQAYVSTLVPYEHRARAIGITEMAWAASWFIGIPVSAFIIDSWGWKGPFALIAIWSGLGAMTVRFLPKERVSGMSLGRDIKSLPRQAYIVLAMSFFMTFSNENLIIVYGVWMERVFNVKLGTLGAISFLIGTGELIGEALVATLGDRIGKKRILYCGLIGLCSVYLTIPYFGNTLWVVVTLLLCMFCFSEMALVSSFAFISEVAPHAKGRILSTNYACGLGGRFVGSFTGPWIWHINHSVRPIAFVSLIAVVFAFLCLNYYSHIFKAAYRNPQ